MRTSRPRFQHVKFPPAIRWAVAQIASLTAAAGLLAAGMARAQPAPADGEAALWYRSAATDWHDALPVGNGRVGMMVWGQTHHESLSLDESTCWSGEVSRRADSPAAPEVMEKMRKLIFEGNWAEARKLGPQLYSDRANFGTHLQFGRVLLDVVLPSKQSQDYRRELDLRTGIATVSYTNGAARLVGLDGSGNPKDGKIDYTTPPGRYVREAFVSNPDQVGVVRLTCNLPGAVSLFVSLDGAGNPFSVRAEGGHTLVLDGRAVETLHSDGQTGVGMHGRVRVQADGGEVKVDGLTNRLQIINANSVVIYVALGTTFGGNEPVAACQRQIDQAVALGYDQLKARHVADYHKLYGRVSIDLGKSSLQKLPLNERMEKIRQGGTDPALFGLLFQYMRYLMIAGSRENSPLPMNLQGIWNDDRCSRMPWSNDHHLDINVSMHYWPAEVGNLSECHVPLMNWVAGPLRESGRRTAAIQYGIKEGWTAHAMSNAWGYSGTGWGGWAPFVTGGTWIASHLWEHYLYTGDKAFLANQAYPVLKENAVFFLNYMVQHPKNGWWVTGPSISPENNFIPADGKSMHWSMGSTVDVVLVRQLFESCIAAGRILGIDADFQARLTQVLGNLPPLQIGARGQLQEWLEDYKEALPGHRHESHMLSVYPFNQITLEKTPDLAQAAKLTVRGRLSDPNWEDNGWSRSLAAIFLVRLGEPEEAYEQLNQLTRLLLANNLLDFAWGGHAGARYQIFCLDGNGGFFAATAEMLMQDYDGVIKLLPALPKAFDQGHVTGLSARGGFEVDQFWQDHRLVRGELRSKRGGRCQIHAAENFTVYENGQPLAGVERRGQTVAFETRAGGTYELRVAAGK